MAVQSVAGHACQEVTSRSGTNAFDYGLLFRLDRLHPPPLSKPLPADIGKNPYGGFCFTYRRSQACAESFYGYLACLSSSLSVCTFSTSSSRRSLRVPAWGFHFHVREHNHGSSQRRDLRCTADDFPPLVVVLMDGKVIGCQPVLSVQEGELVLAEMIAGPNGNGHTSRQQ